MRTRKCKPLFKLKYVIATYFDWYWSGLFSSSSERIFRVNNFHDFVFKICKVCKFFSFCVFVEFSKVFLLHMYETDEIYKIRNNIWNQAKITNICDCNLCIYLLNSHKWIILFKLVYSYNALFLWNLPV